MSVISERLEAARRLAEEKLSGCASDQDIAFWEAEVQRLDEALDEVAFEEHS